MDLSPSMQFVMMRAQAEAKAAKVSGEPALEFLFLGLLKLAEVQAEDFMSAPHSVMRETNDDIHAVKQLFHGHGIDTGRTRGLLRRILSDGGTRSGPESLGACLTAAAAFAVARKKQDVWSQDLLASILKNPSNAILQVCPIKKPEPMQEHQTAGPGETEASGAEQEGSDEMSRNFLPALTNRIRHMRARLLSTVHGQDHVVHAFAEGMFAAEVLAASDEKRKRPRAIFVFAGPPGVGKTFLAEQAAEALSIPFKRFDMSSFSDHQAYMGLVGFEPSYKDAKPGTLTGFVKENPHAILLFDEIEKAHLNTIHLFLQILDAGRLSDRFLDAEIAFKDTIIIFTSNAGRSLYEGDAKQNAAGVPRKTLINALESEKNPQTGQPFFPAAITSRMATGWPLLFNHLQAHHLEKISAGELTRFCALFEKQYGVEAGADSLTPTALLFQEGGQADARTLRAQTELFFKNELFKVCRLFSEEGFSKALPNLARLRFQVETEDLAPDVRPLFFSDEKPELLFYGSPFFAARCRKKLPNYVLHATQNVEEALQLAGEKDIRLALIDIAGQSVAMETSASFQTVYEGQQDWMQSVGAFDFSPMAAGMLHDGNRVFRALRERLPELPVYLLETDAFTIDTELLMSFVRAGARGKLTEPREDFSVLEDELSGICGELYMQNVAARMAAERKVLSFETAPKLSPDKAEITIRLREFSLKRALAADDAGDVLDDVEKPKVKFAEVIGAGDAKEELQFFIDYLKNPKKFSAQGLKPPKGVLLYGPPGTGKTLLAKAMAGESDVAFIPAVASAFVTKYQGSGPEAVRALFKKARRYAPAIVFIDEIDAIGRARGQSNTAHGEEMALNALLTEMDGFAVDPTRPVFVLAATNFEVEEGQGGMGTIDGALARRFDRKILVDLPNAGDREQYLRMMLKKNKTHRVSEEMIRRLASRSTGMSLANMASVLELASRMAVKQVSPLTDAILDEAYEITKHGAKKEWGYDYLERVARHESGHAFLCYLGGNTPAYLTIVARGGHGGYMEHSGEDMGPLSTKEQLINRIRTSLGGRAAEIAYYGEEDGVSTGASGDLESATRVARAMICNYGMDEAFGMAVLSPEEATRGPLAARVSERVSEIIRAEMAETIRIIRQNKPRIDRMVAALMEKNKLTKEEMEALLREQ
ncbi:MAG: AAA family ATPase [Candidatus Pelethousia sp.]|nr:AAA family ATPase [Candidatus Pelethousia sp.]